MFDSTLQTSTGDRRCTSFVQRPHSHPIRNRPNQVRSEPVSVASDIHVNTLPLLLSSLSINGNALQQVHLLLHSLNGMFGVSSCSLYTDTLFCLLQGQTLPFNAIVPFSNRALYFTAYSQAKQRYNRFFPHESPLVHLCSAVSAGE